MGFTNPANKPPHHPRPAVTYPEPISTTALEGIFANCADFERRDILLGGDSELRATLYYIDGLISGSDISELILRPLTEPERLGNPSGYSTCIENLMLGAVYSCTARERSALDELVSDLTHGYAAVVFDTEARAVSFEAKTSVYRSVTEPQTEQSINGAKDSFIENIRVNTSLVRRKLYTPALKVTQTVVGRKSQTSVAMMYIDGVANPAYYEELQRRIDAIDIDGLISYANLSEYIIDHPTSPFPQLVVTERPDKFATDLLDGRVGLLVDGLPVGFLVPATFNKYMKVPEDNSYHYVTASMMSLMRYIGIVMTVLMPGLYIAISMYHQEMLPAKLLMSVIESKQNVPFSTFFEIFGMLIAFELLQEAGVRLPSPVGQAVSIIGALVVGQSAVEARIVSPIAVIVVAFAGIAGYTTPNPQLASTLRVMRVTVAFAAVFAGMFGIMSAFALIIWHMASLESFSVSYLSPVSDGEPFALLKALMRPPVKTAKWRNPALHTPDKRTQK